MFKICSFVLFAPTGIEHDTGVLGEGGSWQQWQGAIKLKQTIFFLLRLHFGAFGPIRVMLIKPAKLTFWVATITGTTQVTMCTLRNALSVGLYNWCIVFGCKQKEHIIAVLLN